MTEASKAQKVRDYIAEHPKASSQEIVAALSGQGITIGKRYVSEVKSKLRN